MLFNSFEFVFGFLPLLLILFFVVGRYSTRLAAMVMAAASLVFYGWWAPQYVLLLLGSILVNFTFGLLIGGKLTPLSDGQRRLAFISGLALNLALLGYFKYSGFFVENVGAVLGTGWHWQVLLPLGISFFTFTQIAFLSDVYLGRAHEFNLLHYALFVTYYPHLIAGPILHHKDLMPQFAKAEIYRPKAMNFAVGLTLFSIGLFKKVAIADSLAPGVAAMFGQADHTVPGILVAWTAVLAYALQLYFDFSGYSDMAIGLSRLIGVDLPVNFNSPYKARSIIDFWRRWHITLSRFLLDYLYIPLGGNRKGPLRRFMNLFATMVLGGLWHGAGWTFLLWGALHGMYLIINHGWHALRRQLGMTRSYGLAGQAIAWLITFVAVLVGWVMFRADSLQSAVNMLKGMAGVAGPGQFGIDPSALSGMMSRLVRYLGLALPDFDSSRNADIGLTTACLLLMIAVVTLPNTIQIMRAQLRVQDYLDIARARTLEWRLELRWAVAASLILGMGIMLMHRTSVFLYFRF